MAQFLLKSPAWKNVSCHKNFVAFHSSVSVGGGNIVTYLLDIFAQRNRFIVIPDLCYVVIA